MYKPKRIWKMQLSDLQFSVLYEGKNEQPGSGSLLEEFKKGSYKCAACENVLFSSKDRLENNNGLLSFSGSSTDNVRFEQTEEDKTNRIKCKKCSGYLGYTFVDNDIDTGRRLNINSAALNLIVVDEDKTEIIRGDQGEQKIDSNQNYANSVVATDKLHVYEKPKRRSKILKRLFTLLIVMIFFSFFVVVFSNSQKNKSPDQSAIEGFVKEVESILTIDKFEQ